MPRIPVGVIQGVFFLFRNDDPTPRGSGFILRRPATRIFAKQHLYGVSNIHVANGDGASVIRLNTTNGSSRLLPLRPDDWKFIKNSDDVSAIDLTDLVLPTDEIGDIWEPDFLSQERLQVARVGPGEDAFMVGLYVNQPAGDRNNPNARFGNISRLATNDAPVLQGHGLEEPSHIVDMRSRTGFSGSPVFAYRVQLGDLERLRRGHEGLHFSVERGRDAFFGLLGVHSRQFPETIIAENPVRPDEQLRIPSSMTVVVPAWRISALLNIDTFDGARIERESQWEDQGGFLLE